MASYCLEDLDTATVSYLRLVRASAQASDAGVYLERRQLVEPCMLILGILGIIVTWAYRDAFVAPGQHDWVPLTAWLMVSLLFLVLPLHTIHRRRVSPHYIGDFDFIDGAFWWSVTPHSLEVKRVTGVVSLRVWTQKTSYGSLPIHGETHVILKFRNATTTSLTMSANDARRVVPFLAAVCACNNVDDIQVQKSFEEHAGMLGVVASMMVKGQRVPEESLSPGPQDIVPTPTVSCRRVITTRTTLTLVTLLVGALLGMFVLPPLVQHERDIREKYRTGIHVSRQAGAQALPAHSVPQSNH